MNPEAENLRESLRRCSYVWATHHRKWLYGNADAVAELVDAAMDAVNTGRIEGVEGGELNRLARAVADFKGTQEPPEPQRKNIEALLCPEEGCNWGRYVHPHEASDAMEHYHRHYHTDHGGRP